MVDRRIAARSALGSIRAEGLEPSPPVVDFLGGLGARASAEAILDFERHLLEQHQQAGPVPVSSTDIAR